MHLKLLSFYSARLHCILAKMMSGTQLQQVKFVCSIWNAWDEGFYRDAIQHASANCLLLQVAPRNCCLIKIIQQHQGSTARTPPRTGASVLCIMRLIAGGKKASMSACPCQKTELNINTTSDPCLSSTSLFLYRPQRA